MTGNGDGAVGRAEGHILRKQWQELASLEIKVSGVQEPAPTWAFKEIHHEYALQGQLDQRAAQRAIQLAEDKYCSIGATISKVAAITSSHTISSQG